jgi:hypothetical protein
MTSPSKVDRDTQRARARSIDLRGTATKPPLEVMERIARHVAEEYGLEPDMLPEDMVLIPEFCVKLEQSPESGAMVARSDVETFRLWRATYLLHLQDTISPPLNADGKYILSYGAMANPTAITSAVILDYIEPARDMARVLWSKRSATKDAIAALYNAEDKHFKAHAASVARTHALYGAHDTVCSILVHLKDEALLTIRLERAVKALDRVKDYDKAMDRIHAMERGLATVARKIGALCSQLQNERASEALVVPAEAEALVVPAEAEALVVPAEAEALVVPAEAEALVVVKPAKSGKNGATVARV